MQFDGNATDLYLQEDSKTMKVHSIDVLYGDPPIAFWTNLHDNTLVSMTVPTTHDQDNSRTRREAAKITVVVSAENLWFYIYDYFRRVNHRIYYLSDCITIWITGYFINSIRLLFW